MNSLLIVMTTQETRDLPPSADTSFTLPDARASGPVVGDNKPYATVGTGAAERTLSLVLCAAQQDETSNLPAVEIPADKQEEINNLVDTVMSEYDSDWTSASDDDNIVANVFTHSKRSYRSPYWTPQEVSGIDGMLIKTTGRSARDFFNFTKTVFKSGLATNQETGDYFVTIPTMCGTSVLHLSRFMADGIVTDVEIFRDHRVKNFIGWSDKVKCYVSTPSPSVLDYSAFLPKCHAPETLAFVGLLCALYTFPEVEGNTLGFSFGDRFLAYYNLLDFGSETACSFAVAHFVRLRSKYNLRFVDPEAFLGAFPKCNEVLKIPILAFNRFEHASALRTSEHKARRLEKKKSGPVKTKLVFATCLRGFLSALALMPMSVQAEIENWSDFNEALSQEKDRWKIVDSHGPYFTLDYICGITFFLCMMLLASPRTLNNPRFNSGPPMRLIYTYLFLTGLSFLLPDLVKASPVSVPLACPIEKPGSPMAMKAVIAMMLMMLSFLAPKLVAAFNEGYEAYMVSKPKKKRGRRTYSADDLDTALGYGSRLYPVPPNYQMPPPPPPAYTGHSAEIAAVVAEVEAQTDLVLYKGHVSSLEVLSGCALITPFLVDGMLDGLAFDGIQALGLLLTGPIVSPENPSWKCRLHTILSLGNIFRRIHRKAMPFLTTMLVEVGFDGTWLESGFIGHDDSDAKVPPIIDTLKTAILTGKHAINSTTAKQLATLGGLFALYPLLIADVGELTAQGFDFEKNFYRTRERMVKVGFSLDSILDSALYWMEFGATWALTGSVRKALAAVDVSQNDEWAECVTMDAMVCIGNYAIRGYTLETIRNTYLRFMRKCRIPSTDPRINVYRAARYVDVSKFLLNIDSKSSFGAAKEQPFTITISGPAGIGKTCMVDNIAKALHLRDGIMDIMKIDHYIDGAKHDDQIDSATTCIIWDDAGNIRYDKRKILCQEVLLRLNASTSTPLVKADLREKGNCVNRAKYLIITTNDPTLGLLEETCEPDSGLRRTGVHYKVSVDKLYQNKDTCALDPSTVDPTRTKVFPHYCRYDRFYQYYDKATKRVEKYNCMENMDCDAALQDMFLQKDLHQKAQNKAMTRVETCAKMQMCGCELRTIDGCCPSCNAQDVDEVEMVKAGLLIERLAVAAKGHVDSGENLPSPVVRQIVQQEGAEGNPFRPILVELPGVLQPNVPTDYWFELQVRLVQFLSLFDYFTRDRFYRAVYASTAWLLGGVLYNDVNLFRIWMVFDWCIDTIPLATRVLALATHRRYNWALRVYLVVTLSVLMFVYGFPCASSCGILPRWFFAGFSFSTMIVLALEFYVFFYRISTRINRRNVLQGYFGSFSNSGKILSVTAALLVAGGAMLKARKILRAYFVKTYIGHDADMDSVVPTVPTLAQKKAALTTEVPPPRWAPPVKRNPLITVKSVGATAKTLRESVAHNCFRFHLKTPCGLWKKTNGMAVTAKLVTLPAHIWFKPRVGDGPCEAYDYLEGVAKQYTHDGVLIEKPIKIVFNECEIVDDRDIALCKCNLLGTQANLLNYFAVSEHEGTIAGNMIRRNPDGALLPDMPVNLRRCPIEYSVNTGTVHSDGMIYQSSDGSHFIGGDCMTPIITDGGASCILGFHIGGQYATGLATFALRGEIHAKMLIMQSKGLIMESIELVPVRDTIMGKKIPLSDEPHPKSPVNFMVPEAMTIVQHLAETERTFTPRSNLEVNPVAYLVKSNLNIGEVYVPPGMNYNRCVYKPLALTSSVMPSPDEEAAQWAVKDYCSKIKQLIDDHPEYKMEPLTLTEVLNGKEGHKYLGPIKSNTSAGFPVNCKKSRFLEGDYGNWSAGEVLHREYLKVTEMINNAMIGGNVIGANLKDEPRPPEKAELARVIFATPLTSLCQMISKFGPAMNLIVSFPEVFGHAMAEDAGSPEFGSRLARFINKSDPECGVNSDFSAYDQSISPDWKRMLWLVFKHIFECMDYTPAQIRHAEILFQEVVYCVVNWGGSICLNENLWPSGTYITACGGSIMTNLLYRYSVKLSNPGLTDFRSVMTIMSLGDDNMGAKVLGADVGDWNMLVMRGHMEALGMEITPPDKKAEFKPWYTTKNLEFLQRMMLYNVDLGHPVMTLKYNSCLRSLMLYSPTPGLSYRDHMHSVCDSAMEELFLHGRKPYETVQAVLSGIATKDEWGVFESLEKSYDDKVSEHRFKYKDYPDQECPVGMSTVDLWEAPWECVGHSGNGDSLTEQVSDVGISTTIEPEVVVGGTERRWDPSMKVTMTTSMSMNNYLGREVRISTFTVGMGELINNEMDLLSLYLDSAYIKSRLAGYTQIQCGAEVRIVLSGSPMHSGMLMASYLHNPVENNWGKAAGQQLNMVQRHTRPNVMFKVGDETAVLLKVPYNHTHSTMDLQTSEYRNKVLLCIDTVVPFFHAQGLADRVLVNVFARLVDVKIIGSSEFSGQSGNIAGEPVSSRMAVLAGVAYNASMLFKGSPSLSMPFEIGSTVLNGMSGLARAFGYSRPAILGSNNAIPSIGPSLSATDVDLPIKTLSLLTNQATTVDGTCFGGLTPDELSLDPFIGKPVIVAIMAVDSSKPTGEILGTMPITPHVQVVAAGNYYMLTPSGYVSKQFENWCGSIWYDFEIVTPLSTAGHLHLYHGSGPLINPTVTNTQNIQVDIRSCRKFSLKADWCRNKAFLETGAHLPASRIGSAYDPLYHNGQWQMQVLNPLVGVGSTLVKAWIIVTMRVDTNMVFMDHILPSFPDAVITDEQSTVPLTSELTTVPPRWTILSAPRVLTGDLPTNGAAPTAAPNVGPVVPNGTPSGYPFKAPSTAPAVVVAPQAQPVTKSIAPVFKTSLPVSNPTKAPVFKPTSFPTFAPTSICHGKLTICPTVCMTIDKGIINAPNQPTPAYSQYFQGPDQLVTVKLPVFMSGIADSVVKLNFDSVSKFSTVATVGRTVVGNSLVQVIPNTGTMSQGVATIQFTASATLFLLSGETTMPANGEWDVAYSGDSRWSGGTVRDVVVNSSNQLFYSRYHLNNTTYMTLPNSFITPGCVSNIPTYVTAAGYLRYNGTLIQNATYPTTVFFDTPSSNTLALSFNSGASVAVDIMCVVIWKTTMSGQNADCTLNVGRQVDVESLCRVHSGESFTSLRTLMKILTPAVEYVVPAGTNKAFQSSIYPRYSQPVYHPQRFIPLCFGSMKGGMVSHLHAQGDGLIEAMRKSRNNQYDYQRGVEIADTRVNPTLVVQFPNYNPERYVIPRAPFPPSTHMKLYVVRPVTNMTVLESVSIAEDYMLSNFIGCPIMQHGG